MYSKNNFKPSYYISNSFGIYSKIKNVSEYYVYKINDNNYLFYIFLLVVTIKLNDI